MKQKSLDNLKKFMAENYTEDNISVSIRDLLTDLFHVGEQNNVNVVSRMFDAQDVYEEEKQLENIQH